MVDYADKQGNNTIVEKINKSIKYCDHTLLNTFYLDYDRFGNELKKAFRDVSDFSKFSHGISKGIRELVAEQDATLADKLLNKEMKIRVRKFNYDITESKFENLKKISSLDADHFNIPLITRGIIVGITNNKIKMTKTKLRCRFCQYTIPIDFNDHNSHSIDKCESPTCGATNSYIIEPSKSVIKNAQTLTIEELSIDNYNSPTQINVLIDGDLVNKFDVGDTVVVSGDLRFDVGDEDVVGQFKRKLTGMSYMNSMLGAVGGFNNGMDFDYLIEANFVEKLAEKNINFQDLTKDEQDAIETLRKSPHLIEILIRSFAPRIFGHDIVKEALIYQLIGGLGRSINPLIDNRGEINIILYGDPSVGKTELMRFSLDVAAKKRFMVGGNITVAGLLGGVDTNNKNTIVAGDAALANNGLLGCDEMNEANVDALNVLNEILEKQTVTMTKIKKGNWKTTLSFLGCTNPITGGKHKKNLNFNKNIGLKFSLLTRIDSIFVFIDTPNPETDASIVDSILESYEIKEHINDPKIRISKELLAKFLYIIKNSNNAPLLNDEAKKRAKDFYVKLRTINFNDLVSNIGATDDVGEAVVSITTRQFQSIIRYATARARLYGKEYTDVDDVEAAIAIIEYSLKTIGYDVNTGKYDANLLLGKPAASEVSKEKQFFSLLEKMCAADANKTISKDVFMRELQKQSKWQDTSRDKILRTIDNYEQGGYISLLNNNISILNG